MIGSIRNSRLGPLAAALIALPLATAPLSARPDLMTIEFCTAGGEIRRLSIPVGQEPERKRCAQPCHACLSRKKSPKSGSEDSVI